MSDFTWNPDRNIKRTTKPAVQEAKFGDGYSQRVASTLNNLNQTWNITFKNRSSTEIDNIVAFLEEKAGTLSFTFTPPNSIEIKVICKNWSDTYVANGASSLVATFERVYE